MPNIPTINRFCNTYSMIFGRRTDVEEQWKAEKCLSTMRQSFHPILSNCKAPLPPGKKYVAVQFLTKELIFYVIDAKGKGQEIFDEASKHLGLLDAELFGLAFYQDGEYIFIDLNLKASKYAVRSWKTHINGIGGDGQPLFILHMRIKYYVDCHLLINEKVVRHHYYLQLRENVKNYVQPISEEKSFVLAALALQADLGNYNVEKHKNRYFEIANFFPSWIVKKIGEDFIIRNIPGLHKDNAGLSRGEAQVGYIKESSDAPARHNLHFYKMRRKRGKLWNSMWLGVSDSGIHIYEQEVENMKSLLSTFSWCDIAKLHFEKKKFEIISEGSPDYRRFTYFVQSEDLAKHLLWICRMTHHFHMANQKRVADLKKLELDGGKPYREAYIYTDEIDQAREQKQNTLQKNKLKSKIENSTINFNGPENNSSVEMNLKPINMKMSGIPWDSANHAKNGQCLLLHHSMEALPITNCCKFSPELKYKSQSIPCLPDRSLTPYSPSVGTSESSQLWCPASNDVSTNSTLMSCSSCASNTDSTCSSLSLTSSSTLKVGSRCSNDGSHWVKCDSFEELRLRDPPEKIMQKVCISTFVDKHVRTASVYDAVMTHKLNPSQSYATSSLEPPACNKIDVKRSPSFNVPTKFAQISNPPSATKAQMPSGRTATRIGVSSLSRDQRLPLTLFNEDGGILACGSEPNLCQTGHASCLDRTESPMLSKNLNSQSEMHLNGQVSPKYRWLQRHVNSRSEMNLSILEGIISINENGVIDFKSRGPVRDPSESPGCRQLSLPDVCGEGIDGDFPCIPPPPAYRNDSGNGSLDASPNASSPVSEKSPTSKIPPLHLLQARRHKEHHSSTPDVMDIHQLRQRSRDLDLPLISALCNDRSLLMLPKTVPTCSRQRHLGRKDPLRFNRTTSLPNGEGLDAMLVNNGRPISWHVDSSQVSHWTGGVSKPCSASWDYSIQSHYLDPPKPRIDNGIRACLPNMAMSIPVASLPPTILTSFNKMPSKQVRMGRDQSSSSDSYRYDKSQMIPMKLLAGSLGSIPNGRLYQKGLSS